MDNPIIISTSIQAPIEKIWEYWNLPVHICNWYFADPSWHCPRATNELAVGKGFDIRMEAKDGSFGFDFAGTYTKIVPNELIEYVFDNRSASVEFMQTNNGVKVRITFVAETEHTIEQQEEGW